MKGKIKFRNKVFAFLFAMTMILFSKSITVYALEYADWDSTNSLPNSSGNYKLMNDVTISSTWNVPTGTTTIDLNGHGIFKTGTEGAGKVISVPNYANITIVDSESTKHYITLSDYHATSVSNNGTATEVVNGSGVVEVEGGYIAGGYGSSSSDSSNFGSGIMIQNGGTVTLNGVTVIGNYCRRSGGGISVENGGRATLSGDTKVIYNSSGEWGGAIRVNDTGRMDITDSVIVMFNSGKSGIHQRGTLNLSGAPQIYDNVLLNVSGTSGKGIRAENKLSINGTLEGAKISVVLNNIGDVSGEVRKGQITLDSEYVDDNTRKQFIYEHEQFTVIRDNQQIWAYEGYDLIYDANGGTGTMADVSSPYLKGTNTTVTVLENSFTDPNNRGFIKWNTKADGSGTDYNAGDKFTISERTTLYAQWSNLPSITTISFSNTEATYDGQEHGLTVTGSLTGGTIKYSTDGNTWVDEMPKYTSAGEYEIYYKATKEGYSDLTGTATITINPKEVSNPTVELSVEEFTYDGEEKKPTVTLKDDNGNIIDESEYDVTYDNNIEIGTATITIKNKTNSNYVINKSVTFNIVKKGVAKVVEPTTPNVNSAKTTDTAEELLAKIDFTDEETNAINSGKNIEVYLEVKDISDSVSASDKEKIEKELGSNDTIGMYLDVNLFKKIDGEEATKITETNEEIEISFEIPESLRNSNSKISRTFTVFRLHNGVVTPIKVTVNGNIGTFKTKEFSTYALAYTDTAITSNPQTGDTIMSSVIMLIISGLGLASALGYTVISSKRKLVKTNN